MDGYRVDEACHDHVEYDIAEENRSFCHSSTHDRATRRSKHEISKELGQIPRLGLAEEEPPISNERGVFSFCKREPNSPKGGCSKGFKAGETPISLYPKDPPAYHNR